MWLIVQTDPVGCLDARETVYRTEEPCYTGFEQLLWLFRPRNASLLIQINGSMLESKEEL